MPPEGPPVERFERSRRDEDTRYTWSSTCSWHGPIQEVGVTKDSYRLPCCPYCGAMLFESPPDTPDAEQEWWKGAAEHEQKGHTNYVEFLRWTREQKRCWPRLRIASKAFEEATGKSVKWDP